ncbi:MAG: NAD(P)H-hydrate dehydratase [Gammaproteobacteria bacterium]
MNFITNGKQYPVFSRQQIQQLESTAIEHHGFKSYDLMQRAGKAAFMFIRQHYPEAKRILVIAGGGNNAGDGYILARLLHNAELECFTMPAVPITKLRGDAMRAQNDYAIHDGRDIDYNEDLPECDLIVDAIFGTGVTRTVEGELANIINAINRAPVPVLSLDIPSGLRADTGNPMGPAVYANSTLTFIGLKSGLITGESRHYTGSIGVDSLDLPNAIIDDAEKLGMSLSEVLPAQLLPARKQSGYKNLYGHVLVVGGNISYPNAARLAGTAAARTGAGLVSVACHPDNVAAIAAGCGSLMVKGIQEPRDLAELMKKADVILLGPGLGQDKWAQKVFARVIESHKPLIVDADALHLLSKNPSKCDHWILTPHPGEAAQLLACNTEEIQLNRVSSALAIQEQYSGVAVLKGSGTLTCHDQHISFCTSGNVSLATGGTGDVLAGILASLVAQGISLDNAANCGVMLHGQAAELISSQGTRGVLAEDLFPALYKLVNP